MTRQSVLFAFNIFFLIVGIAAFILAVILFYMASAPCGGDGCMIHLLYLIALPLLIIALPIIYFSRRNILRIRRKDEKNSD